MLSGGSGEGPSDGTGGDGDDSTGDPPPPGDPTQVGPTGLRRLTSREYDNTLRDLLLDESFSSNLLLPEDLRTPFDNAYTDQDPSAALIEGVDLLAADAAARLLDDQAKLDAVVGCAPAGPDDADCLESFVTTFGRRAFRRPLTDTEVAAFMTMQEHAIEAGDFYTGVESVVRAILQAPSFLYRVERGTPVEGEPGLFRLDGHEVATRLSYFLWGTTPDDALLDLAEDGALEHPDGIRGAASEMLNDARALDRIARFHELWMGYESLPVDYDLATAMQTETRALMELVIFDERRPWQDLLRFPETYVDDTLAEHYGLAPPPGGEGWVEYGDSGRKGLLSHGSFLSLGAKFGDTSPTQRGLLVRTRLFCQTVDPPPPDQNVNVDQPPGDPEEQCKAERYAAHQVAGTSCKGCHELIDPIGFGLEHYDPSGAFRTHDDGRPECEIEGVGKLAGVGEFSGPAELADLMIESGLLNRCVATQLYRYTIGRYELGELDENFLDAIEKQIGDGDFRFDELLLDFVSADMFRFRRQEEG
jgi:hypothetical protein